MIKANTLRQMWRYFGPEWLAFRLTYTARLRTGLLRRQIPIADWDEQPLDDFLNDRALAGPERYLDYRRTEAPRFFFEPSDRQSHQSYFARWDGGPSSPVDQAEGLAQGRLRYFEHTSADTGFPPPWHLNPFTKQTVSARRHWSEIGDFGNGDIKIVWEPSRFGFVYALVRSYWRTGDDRYAEMFWQLVEDWRVHNPPQQGPNWKCGQETSFRVMAWSFGLYGFMEAAATTAERVASLAQMIAVSGRRIEANLNYALSQRNNHGISEGAGLWTIGTLFPEFSPAARWRETGRRALEAQGRELIYQDGAFAQHSMNYHRVMLHDYLWVLRLGDLHDHPFSDELKRRVGRAGAFLYQVQDEESGRVPNYGQNDGALVLPLNNCDYQDFRPVIQATNYFSTNRRCFDPGAWDEDLLWLFGPAALTAPLEKPPRTDLQAEAGGYYTLRSSSGFAFTRCATFRDRPGQADMLHVDLWWRGQNIALDAGTYSYNAPAPWNNSLAHTAYHNTVTVDGLDQMERVSKFLWLPWLRGGVRCRQQSSRGSLSYWEGEHDGYLRLKAPVSHRRGILRLGDEWWLVLDALSSRGDHHYRLHWLLPDLPYDWCEKSGSVTLHTAAAPYHVRISTTSAGAASSLLRAGKDSPRGWRSAYYNSREPALSIDLVTRATSTMFWSLFGPGPGRVAVEDGAISVEAGEWVAAIRLQKDDQQPLIASVSTTGRLTDSLEIKSCTPS